MPTADVLKNAIRNKLQVTGYYDNLPREFCPHAIGWKSPSVNSKSKADAYHVIVYQFGGETSKGPIPPPGEWKCFNVEGLSGVATRTGEWHSAENHTRPNTCMDQDRIELEVVF